MTIVCMNDATTAAGQHRDRGPVVRHPGEGCALSWVWEAARILPGRRYLTGPALRPCGRTTREGSVSKILQDTERSVRSDGMTNPIEATGLIKTFGQRTSARRTRPQRDRGRGARLPRARTAPGSPPPSACCWGCCEASGGHCAGTRQGPLEGCRRHPPRPRLRARRREPLAQPQRRRDHRPAHLACVAEPTKALRATADPRLRPRPEEARRAVLEGQPAEGRARRRHLRAPHPCTCSTSPPAGSTP